MEKIDYIPYIRKKVGHDDILSVGTCIILYDDNDNILIEKRSDNSLYCLPGGSISLYETVTDAIKRELYEETSIKIDSCSLLMVLSGEKEIFYYPNGDTTHYVDFIFYKKIDINTCKIISKDDESLEIKFIPLDDLLKLDDKYLLRGTRRILEKFKKKDFEIEID